MSDKLAIYRNRAPHWRLDGSVYFVTWCLAQGQHDLVNEERSLIAATLKKFHSERYLLFAWVVMNDHVHAMLKPHPDHSLSSIMHSWKSFTANRLQRLFGRSGSVWEKDSIDRIIRDDEEFQQKGQYILDNPRRRWPDVSGYEWVGIN